jgi:hypothetical protein
VPATPPKRTRTTEPIPSDPAKAEVFIAESRSAIAQLGDAIRRVVAAVPASGIRPTDLARAFDLDYALAWQIHALAHQPDGPLTPRVVPKRGAMERFLRAAAKSAPVSLADDVESAYDAFEQLVKDLAGDRDTFDAMLTLQRPQDGAGLQKLRRSAHRANAAVWGVSCRCGIRTLVFHQRPTGEQDSLLISGRIGLQRLYADALVSISASSRTWGGSFLQPGAHPKIVIAECELIEPACSRPLPRLDRVIDAERVSRDFLTIDGVGKRGESTFFWRNLSRDIPGLSNPPHGISAHCVVPTELVLLDLIIPRGWLEKPSARAWISPDTTRLAIPDPSGQYRLPFEGEAQHLGSALSNLHSAAAPQYADLVQSEIARLGWDDTEFEIFRLEVQYPVLHSAAHLCVEETGKGEE